MDIRDYFDAEMRLLHEGAQAFAKAHPEQAALLNLQTLRDRDPYIERLLEGFAFLTAQIRQRIDDDLPDVTGNLLQQLWPQLLAPFPSVSIVECALLPPAAHQENSDNTSTKENTPAISSMLLPQGTLVQSAPVGKENTACRFTTTAALQVTSVKLVKVQITELLSGGSRWHFHFQTPQPISAALWHEQPLRLYLHMDPTLALEIYWILTCRIKKIKVCCGASDRFHDFGGQEKIVGAHFALDETLVPVSDRTLHGFQLLRDYFAFREKYLFIEVQGLQTLLDGIFNDFTLEIDVQALLPSEIKLVPEYFRLHCVPVINIAPQTSEPIKFTQQKFEYLLRPDVSRPESHILHSIKKVTAINEKGGELNEFHSLGSFHYRKTQETLYYQVNYRDSGQEFSQHYMAFSGAEHLPVPIHTIACQLWVSNGHYPRKYLREGMLNQLYVNNKEHAQVVANNITRPTPLRLPIKRADYLWKLIGTLSFNLQTLANKQQLQQLLSLFEWTGLEEQQRRIEAIDQLTLTPVNQLHQGTLWRGVEISLVIEESGFRSVADIYLFGQVLHHFWRYYVAMNCFVQTRIHCHPSQQEMLWEPLQGLRLPV